MPFSCCLYGSGKLVCVGVVYVYYTHKCVEYSYVCLFNQSSLYFFKVLMWEQKRKSQVLLKEW